MSGDAGTDSPAVTSGPRVVMVVANDVSRDTRVKKEALALAEAGMQVTVVGYAPDGRTQELLLGPVSMLRVPVHYRIRDTVRGRRQRRRTWRPPIGYRSPREERAARDIWGTRISDVTVAPDPGWLPGPAGSAWRVSRIALFKAGRRAVGARGVAHRGLDRALKAAWATHDARRQQRTRRVRWQRELPQMRDWEAAVGPVLESLTPDVIHAHDVHLLGVAVKSAARLRRAGHRVAVVYDAHEYVRGEPVYGHYTPRFIAAHADLEAKAIRQVDRVITVSPQIAAALQEAHHLERAPTVVLNTPTLAPWTDDGPSVRAAAGVSETTPLLVYSGNLTPVRGVETMIDALVLLPTVHLALVVPHVINAYGQSLVDRAVAAGTADRLHVVAAVPAEQVAQYLSTATAAVHGLTHAPSHDMALPNKLFEYVHAGLPLVVSDVPAMAAFVREHDVGEVYAAGDADDLARAATALIARSDEIRGRLATPGFAESFSWEPQAEALRALYAELLGPVVQVQVRGSQPQTSSLTLQTPPRELPTFVEIGPANMAGQAWEWARALERQVPQLRAEAIVVDPGLAFPVDMQVTAEVFARNRSWQLERERVALSTWTHAVFEAGRPLLGTLHGQNFVADAALLERNGVRTALVLHGSEIRSPRRHRALYPNSPFTDRNEPLFTLLQTKVDVLAPLVAQYEGPKLVSTHNLFDEVPEARWLPVCIDHDRWAAGPPRLQRARPLVVHIPSNPLLKGSALIEPVVQQLACMGLIEYRRLEKVPPEQMPGILAEADIVLDQFVIGDYGVLSVQAMAVGAVTICHVHERVRARAPVDLPIIEADASSLESVLHRVTAERDWARAIAARGREYTREWHDGRASARVLAESLGITQP